MFVVTFYSYKGGVGRTLALANVAATLAQRGKSVLVVDFDLEAPGASSFEFNGCKERSSEKGGIVEFVLTWLQDDVAPDLLEYTYECKNSDPSVGSIWVMPAGHLDEGYGRRLSQIDFNELYENHDGFLLIEDMKAQWQKALEVDYVLIDSRTGHTDIGGICTRQLPDLVVFVFWPNAQNLTGLSYILNELRIDENEAGRSIERLFVPSNLPTLDDEEEVLKRLLKKFQVELGYDQIQEVRLQHYPSLELLQQKIFSVNRPNSRLAREYSRLANAIQRQNLGDEDGVRLFLERILAVLQRNGGQIGKESEKQQRRLEQIRGSTWSDSGINRMLATLEAGDGAYAAAIRLVEKIITDQKAKLVDYYYISNWLLSSGAAIDPNEAIADPREIINRLLDDPESNQREVLAAIRLISKSELLGEYTGIADRRAISALNAIQISNICNSVQDDESQTSIVAEVVRDLTVSSHQRLIEFTSAIGDVRNKLGLCLVAAGHFALALEVLGTEDDTSSDTYRRISLLFNSAVARWGRDGVADPELFKKIVELVNSADLGKLAQNANFNQCVALSYGVLNETDAARSYLIKSREIAEKGFSAFSCWSYQGRGQYAFITELAEMESWILSGIPLPRFLTRVRGGDSDRGEQVTPSEFGTI